MAWGNPFRHRSTQNAFLRQNDQNAPSQPRVDQRSNKAKIHTKKKKTVFMVLYQIQAPWRFLTNLTKFDLELTLGGP